MEAQAGSLNDSYNQALADLVAVDSAVARKNSEIEAAQSRLAEVQASIAAGQQRLSESQAQLDERRGVLEKRLLSAYKHDDLGYLEVIMGADDFSEFLTRLDMMNAIAEEDRELIDSIRGSMDEVQSQLADLEAEQEELQATIGELDAARAELIQAKAERQAVVDSIQQERDLNAAQQQQLRAQAAAVTSNMNTIQSQTAAASGDDYQPAGGGSSITVTATAYCLAGSTATGMPTGRGIIAVDPGVIPLGSRVHVSGYGDAIAADTGGSIRGNRIDVWLPCGEAGSWGVRTVTVTIY